MTEAIWIGILTEHGPWVLLVFYLLYRDFKKDQNAQAALQSNTVVLTELTTLIRERLPHLGGSS